MKRVVAATGAALVLFGGAAACGTSTSEDTSGDTVSTETQKKTPSEPQQDTPSESQPESSSQPATLKAGETVHLKTAEISDEDFSTFEGSADVTLVSVKEYGSADLPADSYADLSQGDELVVVTLKVENTGEDQIDMMPYNSNITWTGEDGQVAGVDPGYLDEAYLPEDLTSTDSLQPGEHVQGGTVVVIHATQPGKLHFADDGDNRLFDVATQGVG
ncbi:hypothetical protein ACTWJ8_35785 [Streptomyces sp. SDT5-1]|uniref:hypothetical protein n=1 Tax=Streptomyces sp. SDT5-1 TaxID=3406418 RepID=UPI003FD5857B